MFLAEQAQSKWSEVIDHAGLPAIQDPYKRWWTASIQPNGAWYLMSSCGRIVTSDGILGKRLLRFVDDFRSKNFKKSLISFV